MAAQSTTNRWTYQPVNQCKAIDAAEDFGKTVFLIQRLTVDQTLSYSVKDIGKLFTTWYRCYLRYDQSIQNIIWSPSVTTDITRIFISHLDHDELAILFCARLIYFIWKSFATKFEGCIHADVNDRLSIILLWMRVESSGNDKTNIIIWGSNQMSILSKSLTLQNADWTNKSSDTKNRF